jgi:colicin import membrane protein
MKKTKIYLIAPIIFLVIFGAYYWNFSSTYAAQQAQVVEDAKQKRLEKLKAEAEAREAAIHDALEAQKVRKAERLARDEKERKEKDDRENARLEADKAEQESQKLERQAEKLTKDVSSAKDEISKIESDEKRSNEELVFLKQYITEANANQGRLADVVSKIEAADLAAAKAAAAAAAAAAKKNSNN